MEARYTGVDTIGPKASFHQDLQEKSYHEATNPHVKDPTVFKDPTQKYAAIMARGQRIVQDKKFQALGPKHQQAVLADYYKRFVAPGYTQTGQKAPDFDVWSAGIRHTDRFSPKDFYESPFEQNGTKFAFSLVHGVVGLPAGLLMAGSYIEKAEALATLGLAAHFPNAAKTHDWQQQADGEKAAAAYLERSSKKVSQGLDSNVNFWMQTHPSRSMADKMATGAGDMMATLPLYEALGSAKLAELGLTVAKETSLTAKLAATPAGKFVAKRLAEGAEGFTASVLQGDKDNAKTNALVFAGFGAASEGVGKLTVFASSSLIKKFSARVASQGGTALADSVTMEAADQMDRGVVGHGADGEVKVTDTHIHSGDTATPIEPHQKEAAVDAAMHHVESHDEVVAKLNKAEKVALNSVAKSKFNKTWSNLSRSQKNEVLNERFALTRDAIKELPIHEPEIAKKQAEKAVAESVQDNPRLAARIKETQEQHGINVVEALHEAEVSKTKDETGVRSTQQASAKSATKVVKAEKATFPKIIMDIKPNYGYRTSNFKVKFADPWEKALFAVANDKKLSKNDSDIMKQLRLQFPKHSDAEIRLLGQDVKARVKVEAAARHANVEIEGHPDFGNMTLEVGKAEAVSKARIKSGEPEIKMLGKPEQQESQPRHYVSFKTECLSFFKNHAGAQSKRDKALSAFLTDIDVKDFHADLAEALGVEKVFERPEHLLLYANHFREELPRPYVRKLQRALQDAEITRGLPQRAVDELSDNLERHMDRLSYTGRLWQGGETFFNSTKVTQWGSMTKWQKELHKENAIVELQQFTTMVEPYKANFPKEVNTALKVLTRMQSERKKVQDAILDRQHTARIREYGREVASKLDAR